MTGKIRTRPRQKPDGFAQGGVEAQNDKSAKKLRKEHTKAVKARTPFGNF